MGNGGDSTQTEVVQAMKSWTEREPESSTSVMRGPDLFELAEYICKGSGLASVLGHVYMALSSFLPFERLGFLVAEDGGRCLRTVWEGGELPLRPLDAQQKVEIQGSFLEPILAEGKPRILYDIEAFQLQHPDSESFLRNGEEGFQSCLMCPLEDEGKRVGMLLCSSYQRAGFARQHSSSLRRLQGLLSVSLHRAVMHEHLAQSNQTLQRIVCVDGLTQIANRRSFDRQLTIEWMRARRRNEPMALLMCDIDHFKEYNDSLGHPSGDQCLRRVAQALRSCVHRPGDVVFRYGGEEFAVLLPHTSLSGARFVAERMRQRVAQLKIPHPSSSTAPVITVSVGVASTIPTLSCPPEYLLEAADKMLYLAKSRGRDCCSYYGESTLL